MTPADRSFKRPALWRHPRMVWRRALRTWPILIWILAVGVVMYLYRGAARLTALEGAVETVIEPVAPLETARLLSIGVQVGARVKAGDTLATMDTLLFDAATAVEEARLIEAESSLQTYQQRILQFVRDFEEAKSQAQFDLETQKLNQKRDESVLGVLKRELGRLEELKAKGLISEQELARLRPEMAALKQTVAAYPELLGIHDRRLIDATADERTMQATLAESTRLTNAFDIVNALRDMRRATDEIIVSSRRQREILRASYTLRANRDGIVSEVFHQPGDVVPAGEPILRLVAEHPTRVIGFLPEIHVGDVNEGDTAWVWRQTLSGQRLKAVVESIAPEIEGLPARVSPIRGQTLRGRRIVLRCEQAPNLIPGETVRIETSEMTVGMWLERLLSNR